MDDTNPKPPAGELETIRSIDSQITVQPHVWPDSPIRYGKLGDREMRVMIIEPGQGDDQLQCHLVTQSLDNMLMPYCALSYTWGDPKDKVWLKCAVVTTSIYQFDVDTQLERCFGRVQVTRNFLTAV